jgi:pyroglutamyl-peptidase
MTKLLLTAFEPFAGEIVNPSLEVARDIERMHFATARIEVVELPVARFEATDIAINRMCLTQPDVVLMLGEAGRRSRVTPERVAINMDDFHIPDNAGHQPQGEPIIEDGPGLDHGVGHFRPPKTIAARVHRDKKSISIKLSNTCSSLYF